MPSEIRIQWWESSSHSSAQLLPWIKQFGAYLPSPLETRVGILEYASKLSRLAECGCLCVDSAPAAFLAMYANDKKSGLAHIPIVSVAPEYRGKGLGRVLISRALASARSKEMNAVDLEVDSDNLPARRLYKSFGFRVVDSYDQKVLMRATLLSPALPPAETRLDTAGRAAEILELDIDLRIKRDDLYPALGGGIKARKARYIFQDLLSKGMDVVVTNGGPQSNHARACAVLAAKLGIRCHLVIVLEPEKQYLDTGNILLMRLSGAKIEFCRKDQLSQRMDRAVASYKERGHAPAYVWGGGHCLAGTQAFYDASIEAQQQSYGWVPDYLVLASGTGTTQAGLIAGYAAMDTDVIGISVAREKDRGGRVVRDCVEEFYESTPALRSQYQVEFYDDWTAGGYEATSPALLDVIHKAARCGLFVDPTYSGKGLHGLIGLARQGRIEKGAKVLFWHTGGLMNLQASEFASGTLVP